MVSKICRNILGNPSQIQKYGNLNAERIKAKLSKCRPALNVLFIIGFKKSNDCTRFIWTNNEENSKALHDAHNKLQSFKSVPAKQEALFANEWQCRECTLINEGTVKFCRACNSSRSHDTFEDIKKLVQLLINQPIKQAVHTRVSTSSFAFVLSTK